MSRPRKRRERSSAYRDFEAYVGFLYESLGFKVSRNINVGGQEVDVLAERFVAGIGRARVAIECKWRSSGAVSNQDVYDFSASVSSLRSRQMITRGVMVTNVRYSPDAQSSVREYEDLELLTIGDLENQLFDVRQVLVAYIESYRSSPIFSSYIPLRATWRKAYESGKRTSEDIEETLISGLMKEREPQFISILGDYGTGKTTLLNRLKYIYSERYIMGESSILPFFIPLKQFYEHESFEVFLRRALISEFERDIPLAVFWRALAEGKFLILLDGFDEMAVEADAERRSESFFRLSPLLGLKSKVILTCRPSYFVAFSEYESMVSALNRSVEPSLPNFEETGSLSSRRYIDNVEKSLRLKYRLLSHISGYRPTRPLMGSGLLIDLDLFDEGQIDLYLRRFNEEYLARFREDWQAVKAFLLGIYDLTDLMSRPILLAMINETILEGKIEIGSLISDLGVSSIYELYTSMKLDLDWLKGESRRLLTKGDRAAFAETIAVAMYMKGTLEIAYNDLLALAEAGTGLPTRGEYLRDIRASVVAADLQVTTFLTRSKEEVFRFSHRSFMEFFVALNLKKKLLAGDLSGFNRYVPKEILYFLGGFSVPEPSVRERLLALISLQKRPKVAEQKVFARNLGAALMYSGLEQERLSLEDVEISMVDVKRVIFLQPTWRKVRFVNSVWQNVQVKRGVLDQIAIEESSLAGLECEGGNLDLRIGNSDLSGALIRDADLTLSGAHSRLTSSRFEGGAILVSGDLAVLGVDFVDSIVDIGLSPNLKFESCSFRGVRMFFKRDDYGYEGFSLANCSFNECGIFGLRVHLPEIDGGWDKYIENMLAGCEGVLVTDDLVEEPSIQRYGMLIVSSSVWLDRVQRRKVLSQSRSLFSPQWWQELGFSGMLRAVDDRD